MKIHNPFKRKQDLAEENYRKIINLECREKRFVKQFNDEAWRLERKRNHGKEYCV